MIRELLLAHTYWRLRGFHADLVILNQELPSYERPLHLQLQRQIDAYAREASADHAGGVFLLDWHLVPEDHRNLLFAASSAVLSGSRGSLRRQLAGTEALAPVRPFLPLARPDGGALFSITVSGTSLLQWIGRLHRRRTRVCHLSGAGHTHAGALDQRHGESGLRDCGERERLGIYLARQQSAESPHPMDE